MSSAVAHPEDLIELLIEFGPRGAAAIGELIELRVEARLQLSHAAHVFGPALQTLTERNVRMYEYMRLWKCELFGAIMEMRTVCSAGCARGAARASGAVARRSARPPCVPRAARDRSAS